VLGEMLAFGVGRRVKLVDVATGEVKWEVEAHSDQFNSSHTHVAISPNGRFVASVGRCDPHWKLWDAANGVVHMVGARHVGTAGCICVILFVGHRSLQEGCPVVAHTHSMGLHTVVFSPCGTKFATGGTDRAVIVWDAGTGEAKQRMEGDNEET